MLSNDNDDSNTDNEEEDFSTLRHECLAIVLKSSTRVSGICLWRKDKTIQYFSSAIPNCCLHNACASKGRLIFYPITVYENDQKCLILQHCTLRHMNNFLSFNATT